MMSELYELPDGWEWKKLGDTAKIIGGGTPRRNINEYWENGNIVWLSPTDLGKIGEITEVSTSKDKITQLGLDKSSAKLLPVGTVLYSSRATIGKIAINSVEVSTNQGFSNFVCNDDLSNKYLAYCLNRFTKDITSLSNSTTFKEVSKSSLKEFEIPLPPLPEQKRIVLKLDNLFKKIDKAIALHQKNMDEADVFMGSVLNEVFGELEERYDMDNIGNFTKVGTGVTPLKSRLDYYDNGKINWITSKATNNDYVVESEQLVTQVAIDECRLKMNPVGTIIVALYGQGKTRGQVAELKIESATNQALATILVDNNKAINRYLKYFLDKSYIDLRKKASGGTQPNLNLTIIKNIKLPLPPLNIQQKTVKYLDQISEKTQKVKSVQKEKMESLKALKASILDRAFRGEL